MAATGTGTGIREKKETRNFYRAANTYRRDERAWGTVETRLRFGFQSLTLNKGGERREITERKTWCGCAAAEFDGERAVFIFALNCSSCWIKKNEKYGYGAALVLVACIAGMTVALDFWVVRGCSSRRGLDRTGHGRSPRANHSAELLACVLCSATSHEIASGRRCIGWAKEFFFAHGMASRGSSNCLEASHQWHS